MRENYIAPETVRKVMLEVGGRMFTVKFRKSNGALRKINARLNVTQYLAGGKKTTDPAVLQTVWDNTKQEYRCFPIAKVIELRAMGQTYVA